MPLNASAMNVVLSPFADHHAGEIASWPVTADEAKAWAGNRTTFPVMPEHLRCWHDDPNVHPFVAYQNNDLVAYGELWVDQAEHEIELARIIVHPKRRKMGVGHLFVTALVDYAQAFGMVTLFVRVLPDNVYAIRSYESAGFETVSIQDQERYNCGQPTADACIRPFAGHLRPVGRGSAKLESS